MSSFINFPISIRNVHKLATISILLMVKSCEIDSKIAGILLEYNILNHDKCIISSTAHEGLKVDVNMCYMSDWENSLNVAI